MKKFTKENLSKNEIKSIRAWTDDSSDIKAYMWGLVDDEVAQKHSENLFGLFDKYKPNIEKGVVLYRGMSISDNLYKTMGYDLLKKGDKYTPDNTAITSFSKSKRVAYDFAKDGDNKNKVILKIKYSKEKMLDITNISTEANEEETILTKNLWYNIKYIKKYQSGGVLWMLIVLEKQQ